MQSFPLVDQVFPRQGAGERGRAGEKGMAKRDDNEQMTDETRRFLEEMIALGIEQRAKTDAVYLELKRDAPGRVDAYRKERQELEVSIAAKWRAAFDAVDWAYLTALEIREIVRSDHFTGATGENQTLFGVLLALHGRSCDVFREVLTLAQSGYPYGALARWRTLHEISAVLALIARHGPKLAERFFAHEIIDAWRAVQEMVPSSDPIESPEFEYLSQLRAALLELYGKEFDTQYGWAAEILHRSRPTFADIEAATDLIWWRDNYKLACHTVHAGLKGATIRVDASKSLLHNLPVGPADRVIGVPIYFALESFALCTFFLTLNDLSSTVQDRFMIFDRMVEAAKLAGEEIDRKESADTDE
jgi:hypothetical protein